MIMKKKMKMTNNLKNHQDLYGMNPLEIVRLLTKLQQINNIKIISIDDSNLYQNLKLRCKSSIK